jgi:hypothetical protein
MNNFYPLIYPSGFCNYKQKNPKAFAFGFFVYAKRLCYFFALILNNFINART